MIIAIRDISKPLKGSIARIIPPAPNADIKPIPHAAHPGATAAITIPIVANNPSLSPVVCIFTLKIIIVIRIPIKTEVAIRLKKDKSLIWFCKLKDIMRNIFKASYAPREEYIDFKDT